MLFPPPNSSTEPPRVVITGAGIVTALGIGWAANSAGFRSGRAAFRPVTRFDASRQRVKVAAEADLAAVESNLSGRFGGNGKTRRLGRLSARQFARLDASGKLLLTAARECWDQAGWEASDNLPVVLGTTAGGMSLGEAYFRAAVGSPLEHGGQATRAIHYQPQAQGRALLDALDCEGPVTILSNACATGTNALGHAWELIRRGRARRVLAAGYEGLSQLLFAGFDSLQAISPTVCRPFDVRRDGLSVGEGAAMLALETLESARGRGADILAEFRGYGCSIDLYHLTQPHPEGDAALASMTAACASAGMGPEEIDYINAHGTGTPLNDSAEAIAIRRWGGARTATLPVSSTKAGIGHLLGGAGAVEAVACIMAIRGGFLPPEPAFETPDPACAFPVVKEPREARVRTALSNSFGFGGVNATIILRRWD